MATRDPLRVMNCRKCVAAGVDPPFRGTFAELGRHHQQEHPKVAAPPADVPRETSPPAADAPFPGFEGESAGPFTHPDERVPGGATIIEGDGEAAPKPKRGWREKLWGPTAETVSAEPGLSTKERRPTRGRRSPTDVLFAMAWRFAGTRLEKSGRDIAVGRVMVYQSPVAGDVLEKLTKGTIIDTVLQPFAARTEELETAAALFMLPTLVGMLERNPAAEPMLVPLIRDAIRVHLVAMVPIIKRQRKEAADLADATKDLYPDAPEGTDPTDLVLQEIFAGLVAPEPEEVL